MSYVITRREKDDDGYFTVSWSPLYKADKYSIHGSVPAVGGVAELYYKDAKGALVLFRIARSWFGGLRAILRESTDPELEKDERLRAIVAAHKDALYYRFTMTESSEDMDDVLFFLHESLAPGRHAIDHSGRYERIWLNEVDSPDRGDGP
jgi:hypothetical protein